MPRPGQALLDAGSLAAAGTVVEREFRIADFGRLAGRLVRPEGTAAARLALSQIEGVAVGDLTVGARVWLRCQRCLEPVSLPLQSEARLAFVASEAVPAPADCEVIAGDARRLDLAALVEDELLLALPLIARHAEAENCPLPHAAAPDAEAPAGSRALRRPFAGLKDLLKH